MRTRRPRRAAAFASAALLLLLLALRSESPLLPGLLSAAALAPVRARAHAAAPPPGQPMTLARARACLAAFERLPESASWHERGANASATAASAATASAAPTTSAPPPPEAPDVELVLDGCVLLGRAEALVALAGQHVLFVGDSLMRFRYLNLLYDVLSGARSLPAAGGGAGRGGLSEAGEFDAARGGAQLLEREVCDCAPWGSAAPHNRYAFVPEARLRLSYLQWRDGSLPLMGHNDEFLGLGCFERWHAAEASAAGAPALAAQWLDDTGGFFASGGGGGGTSGGGRGTDGGGGSGGASATGAVLPLCQQRGCARGALDGRCDNASAPMQWEGEPPLTLERRVALLRPTVVVLGTYAWRKWSNYDRGPLPATLERIARAAPSVRRVVWSAGTPDQVVAGMSHARVNETFGEQRLEENVDREAVEAVKAAIDAALAAAASAASTATAAINTSKPGEPRSAALRLAVFDAALLAVPLVRLARERADVHRLWLDHVHFRFPVYHALNEALITLLAALDVAESNRGP